MKDYTSYIKEYKKEKFNDNFWKWFGDSKVVDDAGNPLVVYHGSRSSKKFITFKADSPIWFTKINLYKTSNYFSLLHSVFCYVLQKIIYRL